ncbi:MULTISPECIES: extracellular solute-binding protein [Fictibacillus]|uniref:Cyclodextrin-binding protein n=1 Tax=Fictibacillus phosphorivorans TaxID=1221500 RepID=A0A160IKT1_9BACL|nr:MULTISPECIES: extracellular solute-binding protein [Fictibacillus]ANC76611.1 cyclodextrin-binding protein [Fictibacillus phosphorivorans]MBH0170506.1 extracellular solute-binding protein [Fictibacillus sp. 18YEL24]MQR96792.1 extracellular solute-binding protein [Fictibacillus phosphorivorans]
MKKLLALPLTFALAASALAACGPQEDSSSTGGKKESAADKPEKLVMWEDQEKGAGTKDAIKKFEEKYGIKVDLKEIPMLDQQEKLRLDGPAKKGPDVITTPHDRIGPLAIEGLIAPIKVSDDVTKLYTESSINALTYDGKLYGLPKSTETPVFIYNKKLMPEAPESFDDVLAFSKGDKGGAQYGFLANWTDFYFANGVLSGYGSYVFKDDNGTLDAKDLGLSNKGAVEGLDYITSWYKDGLFPKGIIGEKAGPTIDGLFQEGKVASVMNGPWSFQGYKDAGIDIGVSPMPKLPNGEDVKTFIGVKGYNVSQFSPNQEWAAKLVEFITNEENAKTRFEKTAEIPPIVSLMEDPIIADNEAAKAVAVQSERGVPMPNIPEMAEVWAPAANALQLSATGKSEPKAALESAVKTIGQNIEANHGKK